MAPLAVAVDLPRTADEAGTIGRKAACINSLVI
jgi:hypothetical protein